MKKLQTYHYILITINILLLGGFGLFYLLKSNYEFLAYMGFLVGLVWSVAYSLKYVGYTKATLVSLTIWLGMHLSGGGLYLKCGRLYECMLIPMSDSLPIFRYDQLAHIFGFFTATLVTYCLIKNFSKCEIKDNIPFAIVIIMAGLGFGALNEILEFIVSYNVSSSGVGGYVNNSLDLCANFIGAILGWIYVKKFYLK